MVWVEFKLTVGMLWFRLWQLLKQEINWILFFEGTEESEAKVGVSVE